MVGAFPARSAYAAMVFCNHTRGVVEAALGYRDGDGQKTSWQSEGWWRIEPGQCARVFGKPLTQRFYYYYATALAPAGPNKSPFTWGGKYQFCTDTKAFRAEGDAECDTRGLQTKGFQEVDIGANTKDYTLDFRDGG
ncbi:MAG: DUF1036 domain-containing protein [Alphaproteobacteria bacterium]|nr:DUF1036 domain-containing protein [Alphaproteobacteria bacterium]